MDAGIFLKKPVFYQPLLLGQKTPPDGNSNIRLAVSNRMNRTNKENTNPEVSALSKYGSKIYLIFCWYW